MNGGQVWALILAAGDGTRLRSLTTISGGLSVPKQFCSLRGGASLVSDAVARAEAVTTRRRILTVVAASHRRWWEGSLCSVPPDNVIVQPENRGTAAGLLLPLLHILRRDPAATVLVLPSDHFVVDEATLARSLQRATALAQGGDEIFMLGLRPEEADPEFGYIMPAAASVAAGASVLRFVEKPLVEAARTLIEAGALLNMFIIAARARALVNLYAARCPDLLAQMSAAVARDGEYTQDAPAARSVYRLLPLRDFSRDVLEGQETRLRALTVPPCGWSDLGTPHRVGETLSRVGRRQRAACSIGGEACLSLAEQHSLQYGIARSYALA